MNIPHITREIDEIYLLKMYNICIVKYFNSELFVLDTNDLYGKIFVLRIIFSTIRINMKLVM